MACDPQVGNKDNSVKKLSDNAEQEFYGTAHPFAQESVYFVMTDRFVDGDSSNNQLQQGGEWPTFDLPLIGENGETANMPDDRLSRGFAASLGVHPGLSATVRRSMLIEY